MSKRIKDYLVKIDTLLGSCKDGSNNVNWEEEIKQHLVQIQFFMHYYLLENSVQKMYEQYDKMVVLQRKQGENKNCE